MDRRWAVVISPPNKVTVTSHPLGVKKDPSVVVSNFKDETAAHNFKDIVCHLNTANHALTQVDVALEMSKRTGTMMDVNPTERRLLQINTAL